MLIKSFLYKLSFYRQALELQESVPRPLLIKVMVEETIAEVVKGLIGMFLRLGAGRSSRRTSLVQERYGGEHVTYSVPPSVRQVNNGST